MPDIITKSHIFDKLYPHVEKGLSDKANVRKLMNVISRYSDKWSHILLSTNFSERMLFNDYDREHIFHMAGLTASEISKVIKQSNVIQSHWQVATNPFYVMSILYMRYFIVNNMQDEYHMMSLYFSYPLFISSSYSSFKYLPNREIMEYTINSLSNRFILKQEGTIHGMLEYTVMNALDGRYVEELKRCDDADIKDVIYAIEIRIGFNIKNIADVYYDNHKKEKFIFTQSDVISEDEYHIADNTSYAISRVANAVSTSIVSAGFDYDKIIVRTCAINADASAKKVKSMMDTIIEMDRVSINPFLIDLISLYVYKGTGNKIEDLRGLKFLSEALQIFKSNAQDELTTRVKEKLGQWIDLASNKYGRTFISKGKTSLDTYKRSIFTCFVLKIIEVSKGGV